MKKFSRMRRLTDILRIKKNVFYFLTAGSYSLSIGLTISSVGLLFGVGYIPFFIDLFFVIGYSSLTLGFLYFWYKSGKLHKLHVKEPFFILGVFCGVFIWLYYLFVLSILPNSDGLSFMNRLLNFFYPVIVSMMFLSTLVIHPRMKAGLIRTPLWYISSGVFTHFLAFMMYEYAVWNNAFVTLERVYRILFIISAAYFAIGFFAAKRKYSKKKRYPVNAT